MSFNSFGNLFRVTTWGESHGPAIGCVVDGCPPGLRLDETHIQPWLDRRRPGTSRFVTQRREPDRARLLSGTYDAGEGPVTTGHPICIQVDNVDARPRDYDTVADVFRPGHADWSWTAKYGVRDPRGGGRASARETAARVAAGAVARQILPGVTIRAALVALGGDRIDRGAWDWAEADRNSFWCPDAAAAVRWEGLVDGARRDLSSLGAVIEVEARGVPPGWGSPVYGKLDAELAGALMSVNAVKGVEIGAGFAAAAMRGEEAVDEMRAGPDGPAFLSNSAGGVLGGVSTGQPILARVAVKPTASLPRPLRTIDREGRDADVRTTGRHDPCVGVRAAPVVEAMTALVLADAFLRHRAQIG